MNRKLISSGSAFEKYFGKVRPAATMFVAGLADDKMKLEIEVTARVSNT
jgi:hypothetical protein